MGKTRMGMLDLRVQSAKFSERLVGARVANVYDAHNGRTYILKLAVPPRRDADGAVVPGGEAGWKKELLLIESGVRVHITEFEREKDVPSGFCIKLRKHIRTRRLESVRMLGSDRILVFEFVGGGEVFYLVAELFSGGNVILTDGQWTILALLRTYRASKAGSVSIAVKERYPVEKARKGGVIEKAAFVNAVEAAIKDAPTAEEIDGTVGKAARRRVKVRASAKKALAVALTIEPALIVHALQSCGVSEDISLHELETDSALVLRVYHALQDVEAVLEEQSTAEEPMKGYIFYSEVDDGTGGVRTVYEDFAAYMFAQYKGRPYKEFATFDQAADEFFSKLESARAEASQAKREAAAYKRVDKLAVELKGQVTVLESARETSWQCAQAIESNITEVDAAITVIRSAIAAAVPWDGLARMVEEEKKNGNPVAEIIHSLQLDRNEITLMLEDTFGDNNDAGAEDDVDDDGGDEDSEDEDEDEEEDDNEGEDDDANKCARRRRRSRFRPSAETRKALLVSVDLNLGAHANARRHYEMRKTALAKMEKAVEVTDRTIKAASKKAANDAHKMEVAAVAASIRARRKALWFEKFYWFVSSENYLVVAGRDAQQNELLVKRYLGPADVYVHADLQGASSVIVKNRKAPGAEIAADVPRMTLEQAGSFAMSRSSAWDAKIVTSAWWVRASQVSKTSAGGNSLPVGSFAIRGKKTFLDPTQLVMGFAFLFKIDAESAQRHYGERGVRELVGVTELSAVGVVSTASRSAVSSYAGGSGPPESISTELQSPQGDGALDEGREEADHSPEDPSVAVDNDATLFAKLAVGSAHVPPEATSSIKYGLDTGKDGDPAPVIEPAQPSKGNKKHLSAKQRREMKSGKSRKDLDSAELEELKDEENAVARASKQEPKSRVKQNVALPRGKRHKLKKMKKYSDQDDEERSMALAVLGSRPIKEVNDAPDDAESAPSAEGANDAADADHDVAANGAALGPRHRANREEKVEVMRMLDDEGILELARLEMDTIRILDTLTAAPEPEDVVEYALPVCAPYSALNGYRYRAKLMPGSTKRGKAYRSAVALFIKQGERDLATFKNDRDAIRLTPESDGIQSMLGSVRIMAPGLAEAQKSIQSKKKTGNNPRRGNPKK